MENIILNIDTAQEIATVSISINGEIIGIKQNAQQNNHAAFLHPAIQVLSEELNTPFGKLSAVAVVIGPGSYTGLRVGLSAAKGLCFALKIPLIGVVSLQAMAHAVALKFPQFDMYWPMIDARRMEVFTALYNNSNNPIISPKAEILQDKLWKDVLKHNKVICFGSGAKKFEENYFTEEIIVCDFVEYASSIAKIAQSHYSENIFLNVAYAEPLYTKDFAG